MSDFWLSGGGKLGFQTANMARTVMYGVGFVKEVGCDFTGRMPSTAGNGFSKLPRSLIDCPLVLLLHLCLESDR